MIITSTKDGKMITISSTKDARKQTGWIDATIVVSDNKDLSGHFEGRLQAKVYDKPSIHGIDNGRVSKLWVASLGDAREDLYNYDRGLDFSNLPQNTVRAIIDFLENLPVSA